MSDPHPMHDDPDLRAETDAIEVEEHDFGDMLDDDQEGQVYCWPVGDHQWRFLAYRRMGLPSEDAASFDTWARDRAYLLACTNDPSTDGWFKRQSDDGWQITARKVMFPDMSFLDD